MDAQSAAKLSLINPLVADKIRQLALILAGEKIDIRVTQGLRSWTEQNVLYAKGRDAQGIVVNKAEVVTNCPGGHSWHNFGMAVDVVPDAIPDDGKFTPDWNASHPSWQRIVAVGTSLGLNSGATWRTFKDYPHLQLTGRFPIGAPNDEVRQLFKDGGMQAVWDEAELT